METWFLKSLVATVSIVPCFLAIPLFRAKLGVDPLVFLVWYFGGTAASIAGLLAFNDRGGELLPAAPVVLGALVVGMTFGALANGALFQAIGVAPNPDFRR